MALMSSAAMAADLGGNGLGDLEERIAELEATTARKGGRKVSLTISGQVNRSILWIDSEAGMMDNFNSPSRIRLDGKAKVSSDVTAGFVYELGISDAESAALAGAASEFSVRHSAVWLQHRGIGRVTVGHTSQATDGIVEISLANTNVVALPMASWTGFDGGRTQVLRYDSPTIAGLQVSASVSDRASNGSEVWDAALRYSAEFEGFRIAAGVGYTEPAGVGRVSGSASLMHVPTGLFVNLNGGKFDGGGDAIGGKVGVERNVFGIGATTVFGEMFRGSDVDLTIGAIGLAAAGIDLDTYSFGVVQAIDAAGMDVFVNYRNMDAGAGSVDVIMAGARVKF